MDEKKDTTKLIIAEKKYTGRLSFSLVKEYIYTSHRKYLGILAFIFTLLSPLLQYNVNYCLSLWTISITETNSYDNP